MDQKLALEALRNVEHAVYELGRQKASLPTEIEQAETAAAAARELIANEQARVEALERDRRDKEGAIQESESQRTKFQGQTAAVKTNQEYTALLSEIENVNARISKLEEEILENMDETDRAAEVMRGIEAEQSKVAAEFDKQAEGLRKRLAEVEQAFEQQEHERKQAAGELPEAARKRYERVVEVRGTGLAMVERGSSCSACHREVPPETVNRIRAGDLHTCAACQRILVLPDPGD